MLLATLYGVFILHSLLFTMMVQILRTIQCHWFEESVFTFCLLVFYVAFQAAVPYFKVELSYIYFRHAAYGCLKLLIGSLIANKCVLFAFS